MWGWDIVPLRKGRLVLLRPVGRCVRQNGRCVRGVTAGHGDRGRERHTYEEVIDMFAGCPVVVSRPVWADRCKRGRRVCSVHAISLHLSSIPRSPPPLLLLRAPPVFAVNQWPRKTSNSRRPPSFPFGPPVRCFVLRFDQCAGHTSIICLPRRRR